MTQGIFILYNYKKKMRFKRTKRENGETARLMKLANLTREREYAWIRQKNVERARGKLRVNRTYILLNKDGTYIEKHISDYTRKRIYGEHGEEEQNRTGD